MTNTSITKVGDIFPETKKVLASYHIEMQKLQHEQELLQMKQEDVAVTMAENLIKIEAADLEERVELNVANKALHDKNEVIIKMLEEQQTLINQARLHYAKKLIEVRNTESKIRGQYNVTEIARKHKQAMLQEINQIAKQMRGQHEEIYPDLKEIFEDAFVKYHHPRHSQLIWWDSYKPSFYNFGNTVVSRSDIENASYGGNLK